jgi:hypothetical protein
VNADLIDAMLRPEFFPERPARVTLLQTHISFVFLAGSAVYKVKKSVRFPFLDFSTLDRRRFFCHEEVRLNRRLAPDTYRGVVAIRRGAGGYELSGEADPEAVEYAVHMRRLPAERILTHLLERGDASVELIDQLVDLLVRFHAAARSDAGVAASGDPQAVARLVEDNFSAARRFRGLTVEASDDDAIQAFSRGFVATHAALLRRRQAGGRIRECHGDLHSEHVCCTDPPVIFDCIEFSERLRNCDVASEVAFLAMDLDFHQRGDLSERLVSRYAEAAGDAELRPLVPFYACYRAYVRGLVDSLTAAESEVAPEDRERARQSAEAHFLLAYRYTWAQRPGLVVVIGLSGTGKSTLSRQLARRTGFAHLTSDVVRKRLAGIPAHARSAAGDVEWLYSPAMSARTYVTMFEEAAAALAAGRGVILDGTFQRRADRTAARELAARSGAPVLIVHCAAEENEIRSRLERRREEGKDASDADWPVYLDQRRRREPLSAEEEPVTLCLDTTLPLLDQSRVVECAMRERW